MDSKVDDLAVIASGFPRGYSEDQVTEMMRNWLVDWNMVEGVCDHPFAVTRIRSNGKPTWNCRITFGLKDKSLVAELTNLPKVTATLGDVVETINFNVAREQTMSAKREADVTKANDAPVLPPTKNEGNPKVKWVDIKCDEKTYKIIFYRFCKMKPQEALQGKGSTVFELQNFFKKCFREGKVFMMEKGNVSVVLVGDPQIDYKWSNGKVQLSPIPWNEAPKIVSSKRGQLGHAADQTFTSCVISQYPIGSSYGPMHFDADSSETSHEAGSHVINYSIGATRELFCSTLGVNLSMPAGTVVGWPIDLLIEHGVVKTVQNMDTRFCLSYRTFSRKRTARNSATSTPSPSKPDVKTARNAAAKVAAGVKASVT